MAQLPKDQIQFAGEFLLEDCIIVSTTGAKYNIVELVQEINIYENLYQLNPKIAVKHRENRKFPATHQVYLDNHAS